MKKFKAFRNINPSKASRAFKQKKAEGVLENKTHDPHSPDISRKNLNSYCVGKKRFLNSSKAVEKRPLPTGGILWKRVERGSPRLRNHELSSERICVRELTKRLSKGIKP